MPDDPATLPISSCRFMDALIDLLGAFPAGRDRRRAEALSARLDRLNDEARRHDAPSTTLAAIQGAQILLSLAEVPPSPPFSSKAFCEDAPRVEHLRVVTTPCPSSWSDGRR